MNSICATSLNMFLKGGLYLSFLVPLPSWLDENMGLEKQPAILDHEIGFVPRLAEKQVKKPGPLKCSTIPGAPAWTFI